MDGKGSFLVVSGSKAHFHQTLNKNWNFPQNFGVFPLMIPKKLNSRKNVKSF